MTPETLLELQMIDTAIDQLRHRLPKLPEVVEETAAGAAVQTWQQRSDALVAQIAELEAAIAASEQASAEISHHRSRLEGQLKTVGAVREAEALTHEIARLSEQRSALDDQELASMEAVAAAEASLAQHRADEEVVRARHLDASAAANLARSQANDELTRLAQQAQALRGNLDPAMLTTYDQMRAQHDGVAIAKLNGLRCEGCHLDLSRAEVDQMKAAPADQLAECPNCGRLLVR